MQVAVSAQEAVERAVVRLATLARELVGTENLCLAGGVALNCKANGLLSGPVFAPPAPHDAGTALGAAWHVAPPRARRPNGRISAFLGPSLGAASSNGAAHGTAASSNGVLDGLHREPLALDRVCEALAAGCCGAIVQGPGEIGPRALGHRSIVADPSDPGMHRRLNDIKGRERWRPFGAAALSTRAAALWEPRPRLSDYMLAGTPVSDAAREQLPSADPRRRHDPPAGARPGLRRPARGAARRMGRPRRRRAHQHLVQRPRRADRVQPRGRGRRLPAPRLGLPRHRRRGRRDGRRLVAPAGPTVGLKRRATSIATRAPRPLLVIADTRSDPFHVGDEAMLAANLDRLARGVVDLEVRVLGYGATRAQISAAVEGACGVLVSGGGNLSASWPHLLDQRVWVLREAARRGVPAVLGGQTLGPDLTADQRASLAEALQTAKLVGVRERPSADLARALGVPEDRLVEQVDDAFGLEPVAPASPDVLAAASAPYVAITIDPAFAGDAVRAGLRSIASQLSAFAAATELAILLVPHTGPLGEVGDEDGAIAAALRDWLVRDGIGCALLPVLGCGESVWLARRASLVVSSRYHPLVFATAAGVPCLGLFRDEYTQVKLRGALAWLGMDRWALDAAHAEAGGLGPALRELWSERDAVGAAMHAARPALERRDARRWRHVLARLGLVARGALSPGAGPGDEADARRPRDGGDHRGAAGRASLGSTPC